MVKSSYHRSNIKKFLEISYLLLEKETHSGISKPYHFTHSVHVTYHEMEGYVRKFLRIFDNL